MLDHNYRKSMEIFNEEPNHVNTGQLEIRVFHKPSGQFFNNFGHFTK